MKNEFELTEYRIEKKTLHLKVQGFFEQKERTGKVRVTAIFDGDSQNRRFPLKTETVQLKDGLCFYGEAEISLPDVFYRFEGETEVWLSFEAWNSGRGLQKLSGTEPLSAALFKKEERKRSCGFFLYSLLLKGIGICLLPFFLLDGYFAWKGYKPLDTGENEAAGKKAVLLHANLRTKNFCGLSYSMRELKTAYLRYCYQQYKKKPVRENQVLFLSERLLEEHSNLALIQAELAKQEALELTEFICVKPVNKLSLSRLRESAKKIAQARMIILEDFYPQLHSLDLRKETQVVQLWHACGAFKTFGFSRLGKPGGAKQASLNHRSYDIALVSGSKMEPIYSEAFGIPLDHVKALGVPRTDCFFEPGYQERITKQLKQKYSWLSGKRVILFAPTFRGAGNKTAFYPAERLDWKEMLKGLPEDCVVIVKQHPFVKNKVSFDACEKERIFDLTGEDHINDLLFIADVLITDYSSSVFEASLLGVPMIFYAFDKEEYLRERDIYYDFEQFAPGKIVESQGELLSELCRLLEHGENGCSAKITWFWEEFMDALDGNCTKRIAEYLLSQLEKRRIKP